MAYYVKTPIPSAGVLGAPILGEAHTTEMIPDVCSCGRQIGFLAYRFSIAAASGVVPFSEFANSEKMTMCCRSRMLAPAVANVVTADRGARRVAGPRLKESGKVPDENLEIVDAPPPAYSTDAIVPPPVTDLTLVASANPYNQRP